MYLSTYQRIVLMLYLRQGISVRSQRTRLPSVVPATTVMLALLNVVNARRAGNVLTLLVYLDLLITYFLIILNLIRDSLVFPSAVRN